jgi:ribonuclease P protein component
MTAGDLDSSLLGRIVRPADYVRVLATPMRLRSPHFAVHHMDGRPLPLKRPMKRGEAPAEDGDASPEAIATIDAPVTASLSTELSTDPGVVPGVGVDDSSSVDSTAVAQQRWLGLVVPKRHAKRAVTRTLVKRQIRNVVADCAPQLAPGLWVVRQRSPFDPKQYPSAASDALKEAARAELRALFERAVRGERDRIKPRGPSSGPAGKGPKPGKAARPGGPPPAAPEGTPCVG